MGRKWCKLWASTQSQRSQAVCGKLGAVPGGCREHGCTVGELLSVQINTLNWATTGTFGKVGQDQALQALGSWRWDLGPYPAGTSGWQEGPCACRSKRSRCIFLASSSWPQPNGLLIISSVHKLSSLFDFATVFPEPFSFFFFFFKRDLKKQFFLEELIVGTAAP